MSFIEVISLRSKFDKLAYNNELHIGQDDTLKWCYACRLNFGDESGGYHGPSDKSSGFPDRKTCLVEGLCYIKNKFEQRGSSVTNRYQISVLAIINNLLQHEISN